MPYLVAAVILLSVVVSFNLLLTYGIIRRLRKARLPAGLPGTPAGEFLGIREGSRPDDFQANTTDGRELTLASLLDAARAEDPDGAILVGFFSPRCPACDEQLGPFAKRAATFGRDRSLAVVAGSPEEVRAMSTLLDPISQVVTEPDQGPLHNSFGVRGHPALGMLSCEGHFTSTSWAVEHLRDPLPA